jgi:hypothetical protein
MPYIGNPIYQSAFVTDQFSGNGSTVAFTMSVAPAGVSNVLVAVSGVLQDPSTYSVVGNTLTFTAAPPSGTGNISCRYLGVPASGVTTTAYRTVTEFTATASQTTFTPPSYTVGFINVYLNGVLLGSADYTASNGTTVVLATGASAGNLLTVESFLVSSVLNAIPNTAGSVGTNNIATGAVTAVKMASASVDLASATVTGVLPSANGGTGTTAGVTGFKNRIINGAMVIDQRNAGASVTPNGTYTLDRWYAVNSQTGKFSVQQVTDAPTGFVNSLKVTSLSAYSITSGDYFDIAQSIEGFNIADLGWGTASAKTVTLSFWTKSSLTGTFGGVIRNASYDYNYPFTYTISSANTWEYKTITITGATSGTWLTTNGIGASVWFGLGVGATYSGTAGAWGTLLGASSATGATSVVGTNGATFYITGVQFEVGSTATSFDYRPYGTELALCYRYYYKVKASGTSYSTLGVGYNTSTTTANGMVFFPVTLRIRPTAVETTGTAGDYAIAHTNTATTCSAVPTYSAPTNEFQSLTIFTVSSGLTNGQGSRICSELNNANAYLAWSAEL